MNSKEQYRTDWDGIPHTDPNAEPVRWKTAPPHRQVVYVKQATIRNATISNTYFLLAEDYSIQQRSNGTERLEVECLWYDRKPKTTWMHITVPPGQYEIQSSNGISVVANIARQTTDTERT